MEAYASKAIILSFTSVFFFRAATDPKDADIIWLSAQVDTELKTSLGLTDEQYTNQFPYEACLVMKHHLADTIHKVRATELVGVY